MRVEAYSCWSVTDTPELEPLVKEGTIGKGAILYEKCTGNIYTVVRAEPLFIALLVAAHKEPEEDDAPAGK